MSTSLSLAEEANLRLVPSIGTNMSPLSLTDFISSLETLCAGIVAPAGSIGVTRPVIEDQIQRHALVTNRLRRQLNAQFVPINKLPPEILTEILLAYVEEFKLSFDERMSSKYWKWTAALSVCSYWREVALSSPRLWSFVAVTCNGEWMSQVLQRAKSTPLIVVGRLDGVTSFKDYEALELVMQQLPHIRSLHLHTEGHILEDILAKTGRSGNRLRSLCIAANSLSNVYRPTPPPSLLISGQFECLERLEIKEVPLPRKVTSSLASLKHLKVTQARDARLSPLSDVLSVLEQLPLLQTLELNAYLWLTEHDHAATISSPWEVTLPKLRTISLTARTKDCVALLGCLSLSQGVVYSLRCMGMDQWEELAKTLTSKLSGKQILAFSVKSGLKDSLESQSTTRICGSFTDSLGSPDTGAEPEQFAFKVTVDTPFRQEITNLVATFCAQMPLSAVKQLEVSSLELSSNMWCLAFGQITSLDKLVVSGPAFKDLSPALRTADSHHGTAVDGRKHFFLHDIATLHLHNARFADLRDHQDPEESLMGFYAEDLEMSLKERQEHDSNIERLVLTQTINLWDDDFHALEALVGNAMWQGTNDDEPIEDNLWAGFDGGETDEEDEEHENLIDENEHIMPLLPFEDEIEDGIFDGPDANDAILFGIGWP